MTNRVILGHAAGRLLVALGILFLTTSTAWADNRLLTSVEEVADLNNDELNTGIPVRLQATVLYYDHWRYGLLLNGGHNNIRVLLDWSKGELPVVPGDSVVVEGLTVRGAFQLAVYGKSVKMAHHGAVPAPAKVSLAEAIDPSRNAAYVEAEGRVILVQASEHAIGDVDYTIIRLRSDGGAAEGLTVELSLHSDATAAMRSWLGRRMRFRGISGGLINARRQRYQAIVYVRSTADLTLLDDAVPSVGEPSPLPLSALFRYGVQIPQIVRTSGIVSYAHFKGVFFIQDGNSGIKVRPGHPVDLAPGDEVEVIGQPLFETPGISVLSGALITRTGRRVSLSPRTYHLNDLNLPATEALLTTWEGVVASQSSDGLRESIILRPLAGKDSALPTFECVYYRSDAHADFPKYEPGSRLKVQGVLELAWSPGRFAPGNAKIFTRDLSDIVLIARPSWESRFPWLQVFSLFLLVLVGTMVWVWALRRQVAIQTSDLSRAMERDITERRVAAEALTRSERRYRTMLEATPDAVVMINQQGQIVLVNTQTERMFGYPREALVGANAATLLPDAYREGHARRRDAFFANFGSQVIGASVELVGLRRDGTEFPVEVRTGPFETEEDTLLLAVFRDVTERTTAERKSHELELTAARAESANKAKSLFLSTMSHEIRTPMNAIMGYSQVLLRDPRLGADTMADLRIINRSGAHLLNIIDNVLDMVRIEAGQSQITPKTFNIRSLLGDLQGMFRLSAAAKEVQIDVVVAGEPVEYIVADEAKTRQVFINLLGNAVKFTDRGHIAVRVSLNYRADDRLWLSADVEDTGVGMSAEERQQVFQPFVQGKGGQNTNKAGTGLGLAISRGLAVAMGGDVTVDSFPGRGSTFSFEIPVEPGDATYSHKQPAQTGRVRGLQAGQQAPRILIADDIGDNRDWLSRLLTSLGFCVRSVENGELAVAVWAEWNPHLILMDIHMPVMDGLEATRRIRSSPAGRGAVIIALTADAMEERRSAALAADVDGYISKPCGEDLVLQTIGTHLKLVYSYETGAAGDALLPDAPGAEPPVEIPHDLIPSMRDAVVNGDKALLDRLILTIEHRGHAHSARGLRELADAYRYDRLVELMDNALQRPA
jgi:PAS domain S-box-containing protein